MRRISLALAPRKERSPEKTLWASVLLQALRDLEGPADTLIDLKVIAEQRRYHLDAIDFFFPTTNRERRHLEFVCDASDIPIDAARRTAKEILERKARARTDETVRPLRKTAGPVRYGL